MKTCLINRNLICFRNYKTKLLSERKTFSGIGYGFEDIEFLTTNENMTTQILIWTTVTIQEYHRILRILMKIKWNITILKK